VRQCLLRYGPDIVYGIWNEPNVDKFLIDDDSGTNYKALWNAAHDARVAVGRNYSLGGPETSHHAIDKYFKSVMDYMVAGGEMYEHDKVTVHWYPDGPRLGRYMNKVRARAGTREVWLTETGAKTCDDGHQAERYDYMLKQFVKSGRTWWTKVFFYVLHSDEGCSEAIVRPDWAKRTAFEHYRRFIAENP
jgi:hypothetical protein